MPVRNSDTRKSSYIWTDASGIRHGTGCLQVRKSIICATEDTADNMILGPITFVSKSLTNVEW